MMGAIFDLKYLSYFWIHFQNLCSKFPEFSNFCISVVVEADKIAKAMWKQ